MGQVVFPFRAGLLVFIFLTLLKVEAQSLSLENAKKRCSQAAPTEPTLSWSDFRWGQDREEMLEKAEGLYRSDKRLRQRAYFDSQRNAFYLPYKDSGESERVEIPERLILSVGRHIEEALRLKYVDTINFADMGHSHFFIPLLDYQKKILPLLNAGKRALAYQKILESTGLKILYHTAEQLKMKEGSQLLDSETLRWRYYTRNLVGDNLAEGRLEIHANLSRSFNTVNDAEGYRYWGWGFNVSASHQGCFPFKHNGQERYFDLSLFDLE